MIKPKIAIVRGKFLNRYEMQSFTPLTGKFDLTAFGSLRPFHDKFSFPVVKLPCPMDVPEFPYKMPILNRLFVDAHYLWGLEEKLKGFDLVHSAETYYHYTQQCLNAKRRGYVKKVVATVLENIPYNNEGIWGRKAFKARARQELDHIIALTQKTKAALLTEGADPAKITVIGHGIDTQVFTPSPHKTGPGKELTIVFTGRLEVYKGVLDILDAAARLIRDPDCRAYQLRFVFVGDGSARGAMNALEDHYGIGTWVVHRQVTYGHMPQEYRRADIFVAPSKPRISIVRGKPTATWEEQYCTALLEAQAVGLPIVTTHSGGIPENVGDAALLVAPGDIDGLYRSLKRFILDKKLRIIYGKRARSRALAVHDARRIAERIASVYRSLL